jgi:hypothetical protein
MPGIGRTPGAPPIAVVRTDPGESGALSSGQAKTGSFASVGSSLKVSSRAW